MPYPNEENPPPTFDAPPHAHGVPIAIGADGKARPIAPDTPDMVASPPHYRANGVEAIDVIEAFDLGFRVGNAVKYLLRAGRKGEGDLSKHLEDLEKAAWYLAREIASLRRERDRAAAKKSEPIGYARGEHFYPSPRAG